MTAEMNETGGIWTRPGPRGFSINGWRLSPDGTVAYFQTDQPGELNGMPLPRGPQGKVGPVGDPGEARLRVDETVGYRVFLWDNFTAGENMVYGDTGTWTLADGVTKVRRTGNSVETNATDPTTLPVGFRPSVAGSTGKYLTAEVWPTEVTGTISTAPLTLRGLEGYDAAVAQGFPGTAEEWIDMVYGVLPNDGVLGQWLTWSSIGPAWSALPLIGPATWHNITLVDWKPGHPNGTEQLAQIRLNNGTVEMRGSITYTGAQTTAGVFSGVAIGNVPPEHAPAYTTGVPVTFYLGDNGYRPVVARLSISENGGVSLLAYSDGGADTKITVTADKSEIGLTGVSYAART